MPRRFTILALLAGSLAAAPALAAPAAHVGGDYVFTGSIEVGPPGGWDYASFAGGRLYIGHGPSIAVVDPAAGKLVGSVGPMNGSHGAVADPAIGRGFATSGEDGMLDEFDLATLAIVKQIPVGKDDDGIVFDPGTGAVLLTVGDGKQMVIVDAKSATVTHTVDLPGEPEFLAADGRGRAYVNIASTGQMSRVDIATGKLEATWDLTGCKSPHGLGYDRRTRRLFTGCANGVVLAVDPDSGKVLANLPAAPANDAIIIDEARGRVFCPNGGGTLTEIVEKPGGGYAVVRTLPTFLGVRSGAIDPATGKLYFTYGDIQIVNGRRDPGGIRFGWSGASVAIFTPND